MPEHTAYSPGPAQPSKQLILVIAQERLFGTRLVDTIRHETNFQAILATNLLEMRRILSSFHCDFLLLADDAFPEEDLDRLYLLPEEVKLPTLFGLAPLHKGDDHFARIHRERVFKAIQHVRAAIDRHSSFPIPIERGACSCERRPDQLIAR